MQGRIRDKIKDTPQEELKVGVTPSKQKINCIAKSSSQPSLNSKVCDPVESNVNPSNYQAFSHPSSYANEITQESAIQVTQPILVVGKEVLTMERLLERQVRADQYRKLIESYAAKLEAENKMWKEKYREEVENNTMLEKFKFENATLAATASETKTCIRSLRNEVVDLRKHIHNLENALRISEDQHKLLAIKILERDSLESWVNYI